MTHRWFRAWRGDATAQPAVSHQRRRILVTALFCCLLVVALVGPNSGAFWSKGRKVVADAYAAVVTDPDALFAARSPGGRTGALTQTKFARTGVGEDRAAPGVHPTERVLSSVRTRPSIPFINVAPPADAVPFVDAPFPGGGLPGEIVPPGGVFVPGGPGTVPGGGGVIPGGGGGGGGGTNPGTPPTTSVPEPSTWAMLILGFLSIGAAMRRRRTRAHAREAA